MITFSVPVGILKCQTKIKKNKFPDVPVGEDLGIFHAKSFSLNLDQKVARKLDFQVAPDKMNQTNITRLSTWAVMVYSGIPILACYDPYVCAWVVYDIPFPPTQQPALTCCCASSFKRWSNCAETRTWVPKGHGGKHGFNGPTWKGKKFRKIMTFVVLE